MNERRGGALSLPSPRADSLCQHDIYKRLRPIQCHVKCTAVPQLDAILEAICTILDVAYSAIVLMKRNTV